MRKDTFIATCCDACGHTYGKRESMAQMRFQPDGADFEVGYTVCLKCLPSIPANADLTNNALNAAMQRAPELLAFANTGGAA